MQIGVQAVLGTARTRMVGPEATRASNFSLTLST